MNAPQLLFCMISCITAAIAFADISVVVEVRYPQSNLASTQSMALRGSYPLSWETDTKLHNYASHKWRATFTIPTSICNSSNPQWHLGLKAIVHPNSIWELGANHRTTLSYTDTSVTFDLYPYFQTYSGTTTTLHNIHSPQLNNTRDCWIYIPPVMVENTHAWAKHVLVMQDGQNLQPTPNSPPDWMGNWSVETHINKAIDEQEIEQVFVIGPYNTGENRINEYTYSKDPIYGGGEGDLYLDFLQNTLIPYVAQRFQIRTKKENLGIMGSSLGGLISCYAGVTRSTVYRTVGCMSSSFWWNNEDFLSTIIPQLKDSAAQQYYLDCGDSGDTDDGLTQTSQVSNAFIQAKKNLVLGQNFFWFLQRGGHHNEHFWSKRFHHPLQWLYGHAAVWNHGIGVDTPNSIANLLRKYSVKGNKRL